MVRLLIDYCNCTLEIYIIVPASRKHSSKLICCDALNTGEIISTVSPNLTRDIYVYRRRILVTTLFFLAVLIKSRKEEKIKKKVKRKKEREKLSKSSHSYYRHPYQARLNVIYVLQIHFMRYKQNLVQFIHGSLRLRKLNCVGN